MHVKAEFKGGSLYKYSHRVHVTAVPYVTKATSYVGGFVQLLKCMLEAAITVVRVYYIHQKRDWLVLLSVWLWVTFRDPDLAANMWINKYTWTHVGPNTPPGECNTWLPEVHPSIHSRENSALNA